ncbi:hypothetical protein JG688_00011000, partial [Phytophthora aleatoria]
NEHRSRKEHSDVISETSNSGSRSATTSDSSCGCVNCLGHNKQGWSDYLPDCVSQRDTTSQTSDGKMTAVAFAHKAVRNAKLDYHNPEFELIDQGYKRTNSQVDRKQPVTTPMLLKMRKILGPMDPRGRLLWRSIILSFFFLDRCSKLWGPVPIDRSTGKDRVHCFKAHNVTVSDKQRK